MLKLILPALAFAAMPMTAAADDTIMLEKGQWELTVDMHPVVSMSGVSTPLDVESSGSRECWSTDADVLMDEEILNIPECNVLSSDVFNYGADFKLACEFDGIPMEGGANFVVNHDRNMFSGKIVLNADAEGVDVTVTGIMMGYNSGTCS